jgi:hypothetical protein
VTRRAGTTEAFAAASAVFALSSQWVWARMFYGMFTTMSIVFAVIIVCAGTFAATLWILRWMPRSMTGVRLVLALGILAFTYSFLRMHITLATFPWPGRVFVAIAAGVVATLMVRRLSDEMWQRVFHAAIGGSLAFSLSFPLVARFQSSPRTDVFALDFLGATSERPKAIAIIVLDEASPELMTPVIDAMRATGVPVHAREILAAGPNTLNVMPAMLTGRTFTGMLPCWKDILCATGGNVSFAALRPLTADVDLVGFYLPYCAIPGLRTCFEIPYWGDNRIAAVTFELVCGHLLRYLHCDDGISRIDEAVFDTGWADWLRQAEPYRGAWRQTLRNQLRQLPFWSHGGLLVVHAPLPHLPVAHPTGNLHQDYSASVQETAEMMAALTRRMVAEFGSDFVLIATSDHPLRVQNACDDIWYRMQKDCGMNLPLNRGRVPFIVADPASRQFDSVSTNLGLLK